jgi:SAM-dependent methyltransferase
MDSPGSPLHEVPPFALFGGLDADAWRWLNLEGRDQCAFLSAYLPGLTGKPDLEAHAVGSSGAKALAQGFSIYELFKQLYEQHSGPFEPHTRVLDFGSGWGRVIRFFLKDVAPDNLFGIDIHEGRLEASRETDRWSRFERCEPLPPSRFEAGSFDLVYAFSVFSHLSEEAHRSWLAEFERVLRPGGVLILTTFQREVLERAGDFPDMAERFRPVGPWLSAYDRGDFCHQALHAEANPHFGFTFIPERYVREQWTRHVDVKEFLPAPDWGQNVIVCTARE